MLEQTELDPDQERKVRRLLGNKYRAFTGKQRLDSIAQDFVWHYTAQWEAGKAMIVCLDKITAGRVHYLGVKHWARRIKKRNGRSRPRLTNRNRYTVSASWNG